ncbi:MAG TPA: hypothetical protein PKE69_07165 [Pyrinomonadaceae bacterium]|nr:hypothetical protein [Pyrinomonadaceae bacterium]
MRKSKTIIFLLCGIVFGLAAFPVFAQETKNISINPQPLRNLGKELKEKIERGEIDFDKPFKVVLETVLTKDGKFDREKSKFTLTEGDAQMIDIVKSGIGAIGDSGIFGYLRNSGAEQIKLTVVQDGETFSILVESEQKDESKANTMASVFNTLIRALKLFDENGTQKLDENAKILISGFQTPIANGKNVILNFVLPQQTFKDLILRSLPKTNNNQSGE